MRAPRQRVVLVWSLSVVGLLGCGPAQSTESEEESAPSVSSVSGIGATIDSWSVLGPWGGHTNGRIPLAALTRIDEPGVQLDSFPYSLSALYLQPEAASAMVAMMKEYHRQTGDYLHPNEGYRTYDAQVYWKDYWTRQGKPGNAATPGYSNHGWGQAVDFNLNAAQSSWLGSNATTYGYSRSSSENWHFDYSGSYRGGGGGGSSCGSLSTTSTESDGIPGPNYWKLFQCFARKRGGYTGPIDGIPGFYTYSGFQRAARDGFGYSGPIDGTFSVSGYSSGGLALQKVAAAYGYSGPQDGIPGPNTYKRSAAYFNHLWLTRQLD